LATRCILQITCIAAYPTGITPPAMFTLDLI
jgi:hypothetical protein